MESGIASIGITSPGFIVPSREELMGYRVNHQRRQEEGLVKIFAQELARTPTEAILAQGGNTLFNLLLRAETDRRTLVSALRRYTSRGWLCEVGCHQAQPAVQFWSGMNGSETSLDLDYGYIPPSPAQLVAARRNSQDPWLRVEGIVLAVWQILARHRDCRATVPVRCSRAQGRHKRSEPPLSEVIQTVVERFETKGWTVTFKGGHFVVC